MKKSWLPYIVFGILLALTPTGDSCATPYAYIPDFANATVHVVRISDRKEIAQIPVGRRPVGVAVSPDNRHVFVTNQKDNTVSVIDAVAGQSVVAILAVGKTPTGVAVSPDGSSAYVANHGDDSLSVIHIDMEELSNSTVTSFAVGKNPAGVAVSPDGDYVYITNEGDGTVSVATVSEIETYDETIFPLAIKLAPSPDTQLRMPYGVAVSPDGSYVYVANGGDGTVSVATVSEIDTYDETNVPRVIPLKSPANVQLMPYGVAVSPTGDYVYVSNSRKGRKGTVSIIHRSVEADADVHSKVGKVTVGKKPSGIAATPDGNEIYVTNRGNSTAAGTVSVVTNDGEVTTLSTLDVVEPTGLGQFIGEIAPRQPTEFTATATSHTEIMLSWENNEDEEWSTGFIIQKKIGSDGTYSESDQDRVEAGRGSYTVTGLHDATTYYFRVAVDSAIGPSAFSDETLATTSLAPPSGLAVVSSSNTKIELAWSDNSAGESGYKVERKLISGTNGTDSPEDTGSDDDTVSTADTASGDDTASGGAYALIATLGPNTRSYTDEDVESNSTYSYRVQAFNDSGSSEYSNEAEGEAGDKCFIATAAYGSVFKSHVVTLRQFRDTYLLPNPAGRAFVRLYYTYSPSAAAFIAERDACRAAVRTLLIPVVGFSYCALQWGMTATCACLFLFTALVLSLFLPCRQLHIEAIPDSGPPCAFD